MKRCLIFFALTVVLTASQQTVSWTTTDKTPPTGFVLERGTGANAQTFTVVATLPGSARSFVNMNLTSKTKYSYRIRAYNEAPDGTVVYSAYSNVVSKPAK